MAKIEQAWQSKWSWTALLLPLAILFRALSATRRTLFKLGIKSSYRPNVPVIVVGNITVGGSGKTPTVLWLCELLKQAGYQPAVVSRGYGGRADAYPLLVTTETPASQSGDEPLLIATRTGCPVIVDPIRANAARKAETMGCDVIITDDGLQHYALQRDIELVVIDGERRFGNAWPLPAGPMREPLSRLNSVFGQICNGGSADKGEWPMMLKPACQWQSVFDDACVTQGFFNERRVLAIAGIGNPQRFFNLLSNLGIEAQTLALADHAEIEAEQFARWQKEYDVILMTEKDAVKCRTLTPGLCFYLPVDAVLSAEHGEALLAKLVQVKEAQPWRSSNGV